MGKNWERIGKKWGKVGKSGKKWEKVVKVGKSGTIWGNWGNFRKKLLDHNIHHNRNYLFYIYYVIL